MAVEARSMSSAEGRSCAWQCLAQPRRLPPPSGVALIPVCVREAEASLLSPAFPVPETPPAPAACLWRGLACGRIMGGMGKWKAAVFWVRS